MFRPSFKIGKKFQFPQSPSTWVSRAVEWVQKSQDFRPKNQILHPLLPSIPRKRSLEDYDKLGVNYVTNPVKDGFYWCDKNSKNVEKFLANDKLNENESVKFRKGDVFDVVSLLSEVKGGFLVRNNGERVGVECLRGKKVVVLCVWVPCYWNSRHCNAVRGLITEFSRRNEEYELVVVPKMRRNWGDDEEVFDQFFSGFPESWVAVPFSDSACRDRVCDSVGLVSNPRRVVVDCDHKVVEWGNLSRDRIIRIEGIYVDKVFSWYNDHNKLSSVLSNTDYVYKLNSDGNGLALGGDKVSVSELDDKVVALYLCYDGILIRMLDVISRACNAQNKEIHVVMVYVPYKHSVDPMLSLEANNHVLHTFGVSSNPNWWISPFDDFVSRKLNKIGNEYFTENDEIIIFDPLTKRVEPLGKYPMYMIGIDAYPFNRLSIVEKEMEVAKAMNLESLLGSSGYVYRIGIDINDNDNFITIFERVPVSELRAKKVVLCLEEEMTRELRVDEEESLLALNDLIAADDIELVCPCDPQQARFLKDKYLRTPYAYGYCHTPMVPAFDQEGRIITFDSVALIQQLGLKGFSSYDRLRTEVILYIRFYYGLYMQDMIDCDEEKKICHWW